MQNKANVKMGKKNASIATIKDYDNEQRTINNERYSKQSQTKPIYILPQRTLSTLVLATGHGGACRSRERNKANFKQGAYATLRKEFINE